MHMQVPYAIFLICSSLAEMNNDAKQQQERGENPQNTPPLNLLLRNYCLFIISICIIKLE